MKIKTSKLDKIFSLYIRTRDKWTCKRCGTVYIPPTNGLHCSHFHGRRKRSVRWDEQNADAHCFACHRFFTENPLEFVEWKRKQLGGKRFGLLRRRADAPKKWAPSELEELYKYYKQKVEGM